MTIDTPLVEAELKPIDISQYAGKRVKVEKVEEFDSKFKEEGKKSFKVLTEPVDTIEKQDGGTIEIRGSVILNFTVDDNGNLAAYKDSRAHKFMSHYKLESLGQLVGKNVRVEPGPRGYLDIEVA